MPYNEKYSFQRIIICPVNKLGDVISDCINDISLISFLIFSSPSLYALTTIAIDGKDFFVDKTSASNSE